MSAIEDQYVSDESRRMEMIEKQGEAVEQRPGKPTHPLALESDLSNTTLFNAAMFYASAGAFGLSPVVKSIIGSKVAGAIMNRIAPTHHILHFAAEMIGGLYGGISGDPASKILLDKNLGKEAADEAIAALKSELHEQGVLPTLEKEATEWVSPTKIKNQLVKAAKEITSSETEEEAESKLAHAATLGKWGQNIYTQFVNATLLQPAILGKKLLTDIVNQPIQVAFHAIAEAKEQGPMAGLRVTQAALYSLRKSVPEALKFARMAFTQDRPAFQQDVLGMERGVTYASEEFGGALEEVEDAADKAAKKQPLISSAYRMVHAIGQVNNAGRRAIMSADQFAKAIAFRANMRMWAYHDALEEAEKFGLTEAGKIQYADVRGEQLLADPTAKLISRAKNKMFEWTFTAHGKLINALNGFANSNLAARLGLPYVTVPGNMIRQGFAISPLNPIAEWSNLMGASGTLESNIQLAKWAVGTQLFFHLAEKAARGEIYGDGPSGRLRANWPGLHHPRSIKIGDNYYSYKDFPFANVIAMASDYSMLYHMSKRDPDDQSKIFDATVGMMAHQVSNTSIMEWFGNVEHLVDAAASGKYGKLSEEYITKILTGFVPWPAREAARLMHPEERESQITGLEAAQSTAMENSLREIGRAVGANIPGYHDNRILKRDMWGKEIYPPAAMHDEHLATLPMRAANDINPLTAYGKAVDQDPVERELWKHQLSFDDKYDHVWGKDPQYTVPIPEAQQDEWKLSTGQGKFEAFGAPRTQHEAYEYLLKDPQYTTANTDNQKHMLQGVHHAYLEYGKMGIIRKYGYMPKIIEEAHKKAAPLTANVLPGYVPGSARESATGAPVPAPTIGAEEEVPTRRGAPSIGVR